MGISFYSVNTNSILKCLETLIIFFIKNTGDEIYYLVLSSPRRLTYVVI